MKYLNSLYKNNKLLMSVQLLQLKRYCLKQKQDGVRDG